ncbi:MAG: aminomethyltransferase family protein [Alphaproteobacteria bacterium]|jgi:glycine cleavage system aminomethyltransferase T|nr:aminomethyl transferase family protein [Rhodospirillaceae bacterium]MBT6511790.1 aminomethyl transferase family protein [Rhodospirillaceae bacterium]MBT7615066.1 aminomethyl transferase family protein [Rhodospirillaceae bacterium]MBT7646175.1 aminomethyl transferase family protein [Rhodospirillaceae bacterium]MDG2482035.1 aminomethyltransferase family protein [Alphaproteobacteria bacterium]
MSDKPAANYASAHDIVRISAKRFEMSPWMPAYLTDKAVLGVYSRRFYALGLSEDPTSDYWTLRRKAALYDVPEHPYEISGPDAYALLDKVFCRDISKLRVGRATYAISCDESGGILMDGVLMRIDEDRYWYVLADGEFIPWLKAHALGMDVTIRDPGSWVLQVQGPNSLDVMADLLDEPLTEPFKYFSVHSTSIAGQPFLISRTGWTNEMGFELYPLTTELDGPAMFHYIMEKGAPHGMIHSSLESMGIRRIEGGIMDNGTDMDPSMTPFDAGLGQFVSLDKPTDFIGKKALAAAPRGSRFFGVTCAGAAPLANSALAANGKTVGRATAGGWSPYLETGIAFVVMDEALNWIGRKVTVVLADGGEHAGEIVALPFYDKRKLIPRGLSNEIP